MAITGGIKFFDESLCEDGTASSAVSGDASSANLLDANRETFFRTVSSSDSIVETITITFAEDKIIDRLFIVDTNLKDFNIKYDVSGVWTHFASVVDIDANRTNVTRTDYAKDTYYAEFTQVTTGAIQITANTTQVVDAEKYINQVIVTAELNTLVGYPDIRGVKANRGNKVKRTISNKYSVQKSLEGFEYNLSMKNYPTQAVYSVDIDAIIALHDREEPFIAWLCGGRTGSPHFGYQLRGFRIRDVVKMQMTSPLNLSYSSNIYNNPANVGSIKLVEHI